MSNIFVAASRSAATGLKTLLLELGGPSYGVTGGDLNSRRPVNIFTHISNLWLTTLTAMAQWYKSYQS